MGSDWYDSPSMRIELAPPLPEPPEGDQFVALHRVPWSEYDALCRSREHGSGPRMAYLDGELELMTTGWPHEHEKKLLARVIEAFAEERDLALNGFGSTTYKREPRKAGVEPDECYCVGPRKEFPDLAIEVVHSSGGVDKLEIHRRLGVREVWFVIEREIYVYRLRAESYRRSTRSLALKGIDLVELGHLLQKSDPDDQTATVRAYRRRLQRRR